MEDIGLSVNVHWAVAKLCKIGVTNQTHNLFTLKVKVVSSKAITRRFLWCKTLCDQFHIVTAWNFQQQLTNHSGTLQFLAKWPEVAGGHRLICRPVWLRRYTKLHLHVNLPINLFYLTKKKKSACNYLDIQ